MLRYEDTKGQVTRKELTDCNNAEAHGDGVLDGKVSKTASRTREDDPVPYVCPRVLDGTVDGDTL